VDRAADLLAHPETTAAQQHAAGEAIGRWTKRRFTDPQERGREATQMLDMLGLGAS
jgi:hypothetical protein